MKKVSNARPMRVKKRLPKEARERIHTSSAHRDRTAYSRKEKHRVRD